MTPSLIFRKSVVDFLRTRELECFEGSKQADWDRNFRWLDRSGLALPVAANLESLGQRNAIPSDAAKGLQRRLSDNERRMREMLGLFKEVNDALASSGGRYCCVKGFSLVPDSCGNIRERHQVDLDFLIAPEDAICARAAVESIGYQLLDDRSSGELRFMRPTTTHLGVNAWLYDRPECLAVELHTQVWEPETDVITFPILSGFLDATNMREVCDVCFPCLEPAYQFVYLVLHIFRHLVGPWARLLSFYEVALMINSRYAEHSIWEQACQVIGQDQKLTSACALVLSMIRHVFAVRFPEPLQILCAKGLSVESAAWLDTYADAWLFTEPPGNKLSLFVQEQFCPDQRTWSQYVLRRLFPFKKPPALSEHAGIQFSKNLSYHAEDMLYKVSCIWYHLRSNFEFLQKGFRWQRIRRIDHVTAQLLADED